ncbi:MAG TPA: plastocyanin/azurin family copper-binding protein [Candidatus Limnocylindrales bacterium]|nr:plastocyanin/azurin family copper-binding protein [Candidatus Limnocylindrales bacterium]
MHPARVLALATVVGILLAACSGPGAATTNPATTNPAATSPAATSPAATTPATSPAATAGGTGGSAVSIVDFAFEPKDISVKIGTTITWTNTGSAPHTVKWSDGTPESQQLGNGGTYMRTFDTAGSFAYVCGIHGRMTGTVTVTE